MEFTTEAAAHAGVREEERRHPDLRTIIPPLFLNRTTGNHQAMGERLQGHQGGAVP